jgi:hypothetical protein
MLTLDDRSGRIEVTLFEELTSTLRNIVAKDAILVVDGNLRYDDYSERWRVDRGARDRSTSTRRASSTRGASTCCGSRRRQRTGAGAFVPALRDALAAFRSDGGAASTCATATRARRPGLRSATTGAFVQRASSSIGCARSRASMPCGSFTRPRSEM